VNCQKCDRPLYSRQHKTCGFCGAEIPPELRFSEAEIAQIQTERNEIKLRMKKAREKEEEQRRENKGSE
jgi:hypothetical protein